MKEQVVSFETAKLAKEKGFNIITENKYLKVGEVQFLCEYDVPAVAYYCPLLTEHIIEYDEITNAPSQSLLQKWLREIHSKDIHIIPASKNTLGRGEIKGYIYGVNTMKVENLSWEIQKTYEEALELALQESLKLINIKNG